MRIWIIPHSWHEMLSEFAASIAFIHNGLLALYTPYPGTSSLGSTVACQSRLLGNRFFIFTRGIFLGDMPTGGLFLESRSRLGGGDGYGEEWWI